MRFTVAGIGTEVGKTVVSAILAQTLQASYWKPVQAGELDNSDTHKVCALSDCQALPEAYRLQHPMSPHAAAALESIEIDPARLRPAHEPDRFIVELAGGLMVPLNLNYLNIDLVCDLGYPVVLVANYYLGSINHTLLSLQLLKSRNVDVAGIVFNGEPNLQSRDAIISISNCKVLLDLDHIDTLDKTNLKPYAKALRKAL